MHRIPDNHVTHFGRTLSRGQRKLFGIKQADRRSHMHIIGKTGTGKTTLMESLIRRDIDAGQGVLLIDPHGDLAEQLAASIPERRRHDLIYFNPPNPADPYGFNPLAPVVPERRSLTASFVLDAFKKLWHEFWGPRLEHILRHALLALLDQPQATLGDILRLAHDEPFRRRVAETCSNESVREFWLREFVRYPPRMRAEAISPIQNKVGAFLAHATLRRVLTQPKVTFNLRQVMDEGRILLVNLARGKLGDDGTALLGSMLVSLIGVAALSRADVSEERRRDFFAYLDEFPTFTTQSMAGMLAELRKYHVGLVMAHQHFEQLEPEVRQAVLGNVGTMVSFRVGATDGAILERELAREFAMEDLVVLPNYQVYVRLMVDGAVLRPFAATIERV